MAPVDRQAEVRVEGDPTSLPPQGPHGVVSFEYTGPRVPAGGGLLLYRVVDHDARRVVTVVIGLLG
jgi:hypothetical protein